MKFFACIFAVIAILSVASAGYIRSGWSVPYVYSSPVVYSQPVVYSPYYSGYSGLGGLSGYSGWSSGWW
ncbi:unnamed protein product [Parnassius apollo]|uniref:(apollo) hypothetical protein n=1 Tax=Parnassius apollo TaxID=110799 RepID=A0A8S3W0L7_PARAO|nr:unnamed protein product [Parnassius apollo]CAG4933163.1 unnamed protein product [Parnassius apollo]CAG4933168.1 unnamed protein product [Parnassius apollo]